MGDLTQDPPLIGVTTSELRKAVTISQVPEGEPPLAEMALGLTYMRAVEAGGGIPVVIPPLHPGLLAPLVARLDGLCMSGGPDLDPETYGQRPDPNLGPTAPDLDRFELAVASAADQRGMPILAICRGSQALNVVRGGTLIQHLQHEPGDGATQQIIHRQSTPGSEPSHGISISPDSRLAATIGATEPGVNSFHHQAVDRLGRDLVATAWAPDGTIEAIEDPGRPFLIGVQWHAELMIERAEESALFTKFAEACKAHAETSEVGPR